MVQKSLFLFIIILLFSKVSSFPIHCNDIINFSEEAKDHKISLRQTDCSPFLREEASTGRPTLMSEEDKKKLQARLFEGLLHFGTIVNHIDTFIMDKSKTILKSLGKMATSEEDKRFDM